MSPRGRSVRRLEPVAELPKWKHPGGPGVGGWGVRRFANTPESILARCEKRGECLLWPGSMTGQKGTCEGQPQGSIKSAGKELHLRRSAWRGLGLYLKNSESLTILCGEPRCLNVEHMASGPKMATRKGALNLARRLEIKRLFLEGLEHKAQWQARRQISLAGHFGVTRERIRQILSVELAQPGRLLSMWAEAWVRARAEEIEIKPPELT